jgi:hypothetical protein
LLHRSKNFLPRRLDLERIHSLAARAIKQDSLIFIDHIDFPSCGGEISYPIFSFWSDRGF